MTAMDDNELRDRFAQLRESDRHHSPGFTQTYGRARPRRRRGSALRVRPLVIGAAAAIVIAVVWITNVRSSPPPTISLPPIATWSAPTDILLRTPGSEVLGAMPALGASVLDKMISTSSNGGD